MVCYQLVDERDNESYKGNNPKGLCSIRNIMSHLLPLMNMFTCVYQLSIITGSDVEKVPKGSLKLSTQLSISDLLTS